MKTGRWLALSALRAGDRGRVVFVEQYGARRIAALSTLNDKVPDPVDRVDDVVASAAVENVSAGLAQHCASTMLADQQIVHERAFDFIGPP
jgi:hypothetical protein